MSSLGVAYSWWPTHGVEMPNSFASVHDHSEDHPSSRAPWGLAEVFVEVHLGQHPSLPNPTFLTITVNLGVYLWPGIQNRFLQVYRQNCLSKIHAALDFRVCIQEIQSKTMTCIIKSSPKLKFKQEWVNLSIKSSHLFYLYSFTLPHAPLGCAYLFGSYFPKAYTWAHYLH